MHAQIESFFDLDTCTMTYVIHAGPGSSCAVIDSVLDYDPKSGRMTTRSADRVAAFIETQGLRIEWLLETHAHADHLSAAPYLRGRFGGRIAIGERVRVVQGAFKPIFNLERTFLLGGSQFGHLSAPDGVLHVGNLEAKALAVPGHTPADMTYQVGDVVFVGDTLFMPDVGTVRCDFPGGNAGTLYQSIRRLLDLPPNTRLYMCHDYPPGGREAVCHTTVAEQRRANIHVRDGVTRAEFMQMHAKRDVTLGMPTPILPAIQVNVRASMSPPAEPNGVQYLKIPLSAL